MIRFVRPLALLLLAGCCGRPLFAPKRVRLQEEAASTHVAILSVAPFADYAAALQPKFGLTAEQALGQVVPATRALEEKFLDALLLNLKASLPTSSSSVVESKTTLTPAGGEPASTTERREETRKGPGDLSQAPADSEFLKGLGAGALGPAAAQSVLSTPVVVEPMLRYTAANALFQEVQILNRYLRDAPVKAGFKPFVVRLQISVMPMARHMPYDVFTNVAFYCTSGTDDASGDAVPEVIPMLVTDNLEATMHSKSLDQIRQVSLGMAAMIQGVGGSADFQRKLEDLQTVLGRDLNSLLTVGKLSQNMLRVRLGAAQEVQSNYALVPQTHNVTVLLLIPEKRTQVHLLSVTKLRDAIHGHELAARDPEQVVEVYDRLRKKYGNIADRAGREFKPEQKDFEALMDEVVTGNAAGFNRKLASLLLPKAGAEPKVLDAERFSRELWWRDVLWEDLISFALGNRFGLATFQVPPARSPLLPEPAKDAPTPAAVDTGEVIRVLLPGGKDLRSEDLFASLVWKNRVFPAKSVSVRASGRDLTLEFPSLAKIIGKDAEEVSVRLSGPPSEGGQEKSYAASYFRIPDPKPAPAGFSIDVGSTRIDVKDSKGSLIVDVTFDKERPAGLENVAVAVRGASVDSAAALSGKGESKGSKFVVSADARIRFELSNLEDAVGIEALGSSGTKVSFGPIQARREPKAEPRKE